MTAENELAGGFLWAVAYMFLLTGVFGFGAWWILKDTVRWVLSEPRLRWRRAGRVAGTFAAVGGLGTLSAFLGGSWPLIFCLACLVSMLVNGEFRRLLESPRETLQTGRGEDHG